MFLKELLLLCLESVFVLIIVLKEIVECFMWVIYFLPLLNSVRPVPLGGIGEHSLDVDRLAEKWVPERKQRLQKSSVHQRVLNLIITSGDAFIIILFEKILVPCRISSWGDNWTILIYHLKSSSSSGRGAFSTYFHSEARVSIWCWSIWTFDGLSARASARYKLGSPENPQE